MYFIDFEVCLNDNILNIHVRRVDICIVYQIGYSSLPACCTVVYLTHVHSEHSYQLTSVLF